MEENRGELESGSEDFVWSSSLFPERSREIEGETLLATPQSLGFLGFLREMGEEGARSRILSKDNLLPFDIPFHRKMLSLVEQHFLLGGYPEALEAYREGGYLQADLGLRNILFSVEDQLRKRFPPESVATQEAFLRKAGLRLGSRFDERGDWRRLECWKAWEEMGVLLLARHVEDPSSLLLGQGQVDFSKPYFSDLGLLRVFLGLPPRDGWTKKVTYSFKGCVSESYVSAELSRLEGGGVFYWMKGEFEVDFLFLHRGKIYPIEVKSGKSSRRCSLREYREEYSSSTSFVILISPRNLKFEGGLLFVPFYLVHQLPRLIDLAEEAKKPRAA